MISSTELEVRGASASWAMFDFRPHVAPQGAVNAFGDKLGPLRENPQSLQHPLSGLFRAEQTGIHAERHRGIRGKVFRRPFPRFQAGGAGKTRGCEHGTVGIGAREVVGNNQNIHGFPTLGEAASPDSAL